MLQWIFILPISFLFFFFWFGASWSAKQALAFHFLANSGTAIKSVLAILAHLVIRIIAFAIFAKSTFLETIVSKNWLGKFFHTIHTLVFITFGHVTFGSAIMANCLLFGASSGTSKVSILAIVTIFVISILAFAILASQTFSPAIDRFSKIFHTRIASFFITFGCKVGGVEAVGVTPIGLRFSFGIDFYGSQATTITVRTKSFMMKISSF